MRQNNLCNNCMQGIKADINNDILCRRRGVVPFNYTCNKYKPRGTFTTPFQMLQSNKCIDCINFAIKGPRQQTDIVMGLCKLFTVRKFDGNKKNACSKFTKKLTADLIAEK